MSSVHKGKEYEAFVAEIYQSILQAENTNGKIAPIKLEKQKLLTCKSGADTKVDIYWEYEVAHITFKTVIECKHYSKKVPVDDLREFAHKLRDIGNAQGIVFTKHGFQSGAIQVAKANDIKLINLRQPEDKDWDGYLKQVNIQLHVLDHPRITSLETYVSRKWAEENNFVAEDYSDREDEVFIQDLDSDFNISLHALRNQFGAQGPGEHVWEKEFKNGWLIRKTQKCKIDKIKICYTVPAPVLSEMNIDLTQNVAAIMEYVDETAAKFVITADGQKKPY